MQPAGAVIYPCAGAYDIAEQAACGHDVAALRKGRAEECGLNFPSSWYDELAPLVQHLPQVSLQGARGRPLPLLGSALAAGAPMPQLAKH